MHQILFRIPIKTTWFPQGLPVFGFGMMLFAAFIVCTWLAGRRAEREGVAKEHVQDLAIWLFLGGLLGARITFLLKEYHPTDLWDFLTQLPRIWDGGIILYGSFIGAVVAYVVAHRLVFRKHGLRPLQLVDIVAPSVAVGICLGRIGCLLNGCCYGLPACAECAVRPVHFPLAAPPRYALTGSGLQTAAGFTLAEDQPLDGGVRVGRVEPGSAAALAGLRDGDLIVEAEGKSMRSADDLASILGARWPQGQAELTLGVAGGTGPLEFVPRTIGLLPTQLYESVSMFLLFVLLTAYYPLRTRRGQVTALLMVCYGAHRSLNELLRGDPRPIGFESAGSIGLMIGGLALAIWLKTQPAEFSLQWAGTNSGDAPSAGTSPDKT